jgi:ribose transport system permease protein
MTAPAALERAPRRLTVSTVADRYGLLVAWAALIVFFSILLPDTFFRLENFQTILGSQAVLLVLTLGLIVPLTVNEFDLSVAGVINITVVLMGFLNGVHEWALVPTLVAVLLGALIVGSVNAFLTVRLGIQSIIVTLGMGTLLQGLALGINPNAVPNLAQPLVDLMRSTILGIQFAFYCGLALTVVVWYVYRFTPLGRYLYFVGAGRDVARLAGLRVDAIRIGALLTSSIAAALAGIMLVGLLGSADPNVGPSFLLPAFAAAFLGATVLHPGRFNPWGTFIAVYFLVTGITGLQLLGLSSWIESVFYGGSLVIAVAIAQVKEEEGTCWELGVVPESVPPSPSAPSR